MEIRVSSLEGKKEKKRKVGWTVEQSWFLGRHRWVPELRRVCQSLAEFSPCSSLSFFSSRFSPPLSDSLFSRSFLMTLEVPVLSVTRSLSDLPSQWRISAPLFSSVLVATLLHKIGEEQPGEQQRRGGRPPSMPAQPCKTWTLRAGLTLCSARTVPAGWAKFQVCPWQSVLVFVSFRSLRTYCRYNDTFRRMLEHTKEI